MEISWVEDNPFKADTNTIKVDLYSGKVESIEMTNQGVQVVGIEITDKQFYIDTLEKDCKNLARISSFIIISFLAFSHAHHNIFFYTIKLVVPRSYKIFILVV